MGAFAKHHVVIRILKEINYVCNLFLFAIASTVRLHQTLPVVYL